MEAVCRVSEGALLIGREEVGASIPPLRDLHAALEVPWECRPQLLEVALSLTRQALKVLFDDGAIDLVRVEVAEGPLEPGHQPTRHVCPRLAVLSKLSKPGVQKLPHRGAIFNSAFRVHLVRECLPCLRFILAARAQLFGFVDDVELAASRELFESRRLGFAGAFMGLAKGLNVLGADADVTFTTAETAKSAVLEPCVSRVVSQSEMRRP